MAYSTGEFEADAARVARSLHLAYRRCRYLQDRWYSGLNAGFPNEGGGIPMNNLMNRVGELVTAYEADTNAKLNTVLAMSDLVLPGDA